MISKSHILVTGGAGFIGSNFVRLACASGYKVLVLDSLTYAGHQENLADLSGKFEFVKGDIRDRTLVTQLLDKFSIKAIINFAAESHVDRSIEDPLVFVETNILGTANLLNCGLEYWQTNGSDKTFRYLQISTDEVYGSLGATGKFSEKTPLNPSSPYSASKTGADHLVQAWHHTFGLPTLITRCSNNYGPYQYPEKLIPHMINCALGGKPLPVYGDGANIRDWIHVEDHCQGILLALERGTPGNTYCLGGSSEYRNIDLVKVICTELDRVVPLNSGKSYAEQITFVKDRLGHDHRYAIDDSVAKKELGFKCKYDFSKGIQDTIAWYLHNESWRKAVMGVKV